MDDLDSFWQLLQEAILAVNRQAEKIDALSARVAELEHLLGVETVSQ